MKNLKWLTASALIVTVIVGASFYFPTTPTANAAAGPQIVIGGSNGTFSVNFVYSAIGFGVATNAGSLGNVMPVAGTISNLVINSDIEPGGVTTRTVTLRKNGVNTTLTCTIASASTVCPTDTTHTVSVVAGDIIAIFGANSGSPAAAHVGWSFVFTPTNTGDTVLFGGQGGNGGIGTGSYLTNAFYLGMGTLFSNTPSANVTVLPTGGTIDNLQASTTNLQNGNYLISLMQGVGGATPATSTLQCTLTTDNCGDTSHSVSVATGDTITTSFASTSVRIVFKGGVSVRFVPTNAGDFVFMNTTGLSADTAGATRYYPVTGYIGAALTAEASTTAPVAATTTVTSMQLLRSAAPGSGKNATTTLRVNGVDSSLSCALTGTGSGDGKTTKTCTGSVSLSASDLIDYSIALDTGGTTGSYRISLVANSNTATPASGDDGSSNWFSVL